MPQAEPRSPEERIIRACNHLAHAFAECVLAAVEASRQGGNAAPAGNGQSEATQEAKERLPTAAPAAETAPEPSKKWRFTTDGSHRYFFAPAAEGETLKSLPLPDHRALALQVTKDLTRPEGGWNKTQFVTCLRTVRANVELFAELDRGEYQKIDPLIAHVEQLATERGLEI